jgi:predicted AlkP superfamily pyrophosphatase or phosphodiesterase
MKRILLFCTSLFSLGLLCAQPGKKKALFVIADGIPYDVIKKVPTPHLDSLGRAGAFLQAYVGGEKDGYSQTPTISAVGYNSLLTGTWVNKHNVWDNAIADPNYYYHSIFRLFQEQFPGGKTAVYSSWLDNRTKLIGDGLPQTGSFKVNDYYDGLELDTLQFPHDKNGDYMHQIDEAVVTKAAEGIRKFSPDLTWVYLEYTDDMGHKYGDSKQFYDAVAMMDTQLGRLFEAIAFRQQKFQEDWDIYITTDHGRDAKTGRNHGGQSERERTTWIVTNAQDVNPWFIRHPPGIVDIMPSLAGHLGIIIPREEAMEIDGIPLTGKLSAVEPQAVFENGQITVRWKALQKTGMAKIWLATSNHFKTGGRDDYKLVKTVALSKEETVVDVRDRPSSIYKIVIETPSNWLNRWVLLKTNH